MTQPTEPTPVKDELAAMSKIVRILDTVDRTAADRIASWMFDRYSAEALPGEQPTATSEPKP
jgi:hypothetical protein